MADRITKARGRRSRLERDEEEGELALPSAGGSTVVVAGIDAGAQVPIQKISGPSGGPGRADLARHEILDRLSHGGISDLERQHRLATDVFMSDEDRAAYSRKRSAAAQESAMKTEAAGRQQTQNLDMLAGLDTLGFRPRMPQLAGGNSRTDVEAAGPAAHPGLSIIDRSGNARPQTEVQPQPQTETAGTGAASPSPAFAPKRSSSPIEEILVKIGRIISSMLGFSSGGPSSRPPMR